MAKLKGYIDSCIKNKNYTGQDKSNLFARIRDRVQLFVGMQEKGGLSPGNFTGLDRLIAERVIALSQGAGSSTIDYSVPTSTAKSRPKVFTKTDESEEPGVGYIVWAGNEAYKCPWLKEYVTEDSSDNSGNAYVPTQSTQFDSMATGVTFDSTATVTDLNRHIYLSEYRIAFLSKYTSKLIISTRNDRDSFESGGASGDPIKEIDLSPYTPAGNWSYGKILHDNGFLYVGLVSYPDDRTKTAVEQPRMSTPDAVSALGYTVDIQLLVINLESGAVAPLRVEHSTAIQTKLNIIRGYTDFILHNSKVFAIRSKPTASTVSFTAKRLSERAGSQELVSVGTVTHKFDSYQFELVELIPSTQSGLSVTTQHIYTVLPPPPEDEGKFGIKGSSIAYVAAKLAASDLSPYTFHVQLFYELVLQLPYDYGKGFDCGLYLETSVGAKLRPGSRLYSDNFYSSFINGTINEDVYGGAQLLQSLPGIKLGGITKIAGCLFLEAPASYDTNTKEYTVHVDSYANLLYELTGESQPVYSPQTNGWELWRPKVAPKDYYPWNWYAKMAAALDIWVAYHVISNSLNTGCSKTGSVIANTGLTLRTGMHEAAIDVQNRLHNGEHLPDITTDIANWVWSKKTDAEDPRKTTKWLQALDIELGDFPFPYEKRYSFFGGYRGSQSWPVSGYVPHGETFLVSYNGTKIAANGETTTESARPVYIIKGVGAYSSKWGAQGWSGQMTESPLVVEVYRHETVNDIDIPAFSKVNDSSMPKVYMQGNCTVLGTIGDYATSFDLTDMDTHTEHGMYPIAQNGYYVNEQKSLVMMDRKTFTDMRLNPSDPREVYYALFVNHNEYDQTELKQVMLNYYLETRSYRLMEKETEGSFKLTLNAAKVLAYWWSRSIPAKLTDPVPWWGPCQIDMHIKL